MSEPAKDAAASSELSTRFVAGVVMIAVACTLIYLGGTEGGAVGAWLFRLFIVAGASIVLIEWADMHKVSRPWAYLGAVILSAGILALSERLYPAGGIEVIDGIEGVDAVTFHRAWVGFAGLVAVGLPYGAVSRRLALGWGFLYAAVPAFSLIVIEWARFDLVFWLMLVTWSTDIFAYFAGRSIGGPKLAPRISPNKTWSGLAGGMLGAAVIGGAAAWLLGIGNPFLWLGAPLGLLAQLGDLYESRIKRRLGVKDSGTLLPGHGGVLDRVDGLLPVCVATLLVLMAVLEFS